MAWYYYNKSGNKMGTFSNSELKELAQKGKITPDTRIEDENGRTALAKDIKGLTFPESALTEENPFTTPRPAGQTSSIVLPPANLFCTNCGNSISAQAVACMSCGAKPTGHKKFCRHCGVGLNPGQVVCIKCGAAISAGYQDTAKKTYSAIMPVVMQTAQSVMQKVKTLPKSTIIAIAVVVGVLGLAWFLFGNDSPSTVVEKYHTAMEKGDLKTLKRIVPTFKDLDAQWRMQMLADAPMEMAAAGRTRRDIGSISHIINGNTAAVTVVYKNASIRSYSLVKVNGRWKMKGW
jgi:hypothetical protein